MSIEHTSYIHVWVLHMKCMSFTWSAWVSWMLIRESHIQYVLFHTWWHVFTSAYYNSYMTIYELRFWYEYYTDMYDTHHPLFSDWVGHLNLRKVQTINQIIGQCSILWFSWFDPISIFISMSILKRRFPHGHSSANISRLLSIQRKASITADALSRICCCHTGVDLSVCLKGKSALTPFIQSLSTNF